MPSITDTVATPDGTCTVTLHTPAGTGPWPAVIMYPDAGGVRDAIQGMAATVADFGYAVLVPDFYYREAPWAPFSMATAFGDPDERKRLMSMMGNVTPERMGSDAGAFISYLLGRPEVSGDKVGTTGYCMGGRMSLVVAGRQPERVGAAASFHGGGLASEDPGSPHLLADKMQAAVYVAGAQNDQSFTPEQAETLDKTLTAAGVQHTIEIYPAGHGFAVPDNTPYDADAASRHYAATKEFFGANLSG
jgi:carboxymethylenebutenolidase